MYIKKFCMIGALLCVQSCLAILQNTFIDFITGFNAPSNIAITSNSLYAYVVDGGSNSVLVIDTNPSSPTFNKLIPAPNLNGVFNNPNDVATTPNNKFAYVTDNGSNSVRVINIDPSRSAFNSLISAPALVGAFNSPGGIAITPNGLYAYVINSGDNSVKVIDLNPASVTYNTVLNTPALNGILNSPFGIAITPDGRYAYVSNLTGSVTVIDTNSASSTFNTPIAAPGLASVNAQPEGLAITINSQFGYVSNGAGTSVTVINTNPTSSAFNTVVSAPNLNNAFNFSNDVATTADGNYAYVSNFLGASGSISSVSVIDTNPTSPTYNSTISTPGLNLPGTTRFISLAATPNAQYVYVVDGFNNTVDVIYTGIIAAPRNVAGCTFVNKFLSQMEYVNRLTWYAPFVGNTPVSYKIYRDANLTQLVATIPATGVLLYDDHNRDPLVKDTYYIVSVDALGNKSPSVSTTVRQQC